MQGYVVFHKETGEVLLAHTEVTLEGEPRRPDHRELIEAFLLAREDKRVKAGELDVLEVDAERLQAGPSGGIQIYVDVEKGSLAEREAEAQAAE